MRSLSAVLDLGFDTWRRSEDVSPALPQRTRSSKAHPFREVSTLRRVS